MPDYELLELVLFRALRRQDVKPVARCLLERFHDFNGVISVPIDQLLSVPGIGGAVVTELKIVEAAAHRLSQTRILGRQILSNWDRLLEHCQITIAYRALEGFWVLFLDRKNVLIVQEQQSEGTVDHVPVYQRKILIASGRPYFTINPCSQTPKVIPFSCFGEDMCESET